MKRKAPDGAARLAFSPGLIPWVGKVSIAYIEVDMAKET
jgi:hypothetical protein